MEKHRKSFKELTIKDNFMFAAVMLEPENAKGLLELALGITVDHVDVSYEKSIVYNPEYKGVRLDVFLKDEEGTHFNVEMQAASQPLEKRARYYHSQIDMEMLVSGSAYERISDNYVLFICDFDPIGLKKYRYTVVHTFAEDRTFDYRDGNHTVFLSTAGTDEEAVPEALVNFLKYVAAEPEAGEKDYGDGYVEQLQNSVRKIKKSRDMEGRYMLFEEMMQNEYKSGHRDGMEEGRREGLMAQINYIVQTISARFTISGKLSEKLQLIEDSDTLSELLIAAATVASAEEFELKLDMLLSDQIRSTEID